VLNNACVAGDVVVTQGYTLSSIANALPSTGGTVTGATTFNSTVTINGGSASGYTGYKNRIINGGMVIDQRNAGASVTPTGGVYSLDRWGAFLSQASKYSFQRNAGSVTPPTGFTNYLGITSTSAYSITSSDFFFISQTVEGFNWADMAYGTASAQPATLSFWVRSSLTGTFGGACRGFDGVSVLRSYPFTYTISSANTWTYITVAIPGDTTASLAWSSTQSTTNGYGFIVNFGLGVGSTQSSTAGAWATGNFTSATGATSVVGTSGATFYVTGVQFERGSNATSFEFRDYGRELMMCQRYYQRITRTSASTADVTGAFATGAAWANAYQATISLPVTMRSAPTIDSTASTTFQFHIGGVTNTALGSITFNQSAVDGVRVAGGWVYAGTNGLAGQIAAYNATAYIGFSSEL
jgi:hypothetical protein